MAEGADPYVSTIEAQGWHVYDITDDLRRGAVSPWQELAERQGAAKCLGRGSTYLLAPIPEEGQTQSEAYNVTKGVGPSLRLHDYNSPEYAQFILRYTRLRVMFTRIALESAGVRLYMPPSQNDALAPPMVLLPYETAVQTFQRDFEAISAQQFEREVADSARWSLSQSN